MKSITNFITESKESDNKFFCEHFIMMLKGTKFTKEQVQLLMNNLEIETIKYISDYFNTTDGSNYMSYEPSQDLFLNNNSKEKVTKIISEYVSKTICN